MKKTCKWPGLTVLCAVLTLICGSIPHVELLAAGADESPSGTAAEDGSEQDDNAAGVEEDIQSVRVTDIYTAEDFVQFAEQCHMDAWSVGRKVRLCADIDLSGADVQTVPVFSGTFDGGGHTISGYQSTDGYVEGLFRYIEKDGVVENLHLSGNIESAEDEECIGGICGVNYGTIQDCSFEGSMSGRDTVGGIVGVNEGTGLVTRCKVTGHVDGYYMTGGIAGLNHGDITFCRNHSGINDDNKWVETDDEMGVGIFFSISATDSDVEFYSGVDTGGIAGYSDGFIAACENYGSVGYEHTGYNIGGIVGRHSGVVSMCTNSGRICGRKDVGGIVGQMEPFVEVDEAQSLRNAVNRLHDLIDTTLDHMQSGKDVMKADMDNLTLYGDGARNAGHALADQLTDFVDTNVSMLSELRVRTEYVTGQIPAILDDLSTAREAFGGFGEAVKNAVGDMTMESVSGNDTDVVTGDAPADLDTDGLKSTTDRVNTSLERIEALTASLGEQELAGADGAQILQELRDLEDAIGDLTESVSSAENALNRISDAAVPGRTGRDLEEASEKLRVMQEALKSAENRLQSVVSYINSQPVLRFTVLGQDFTQNREQLNVQLTGISDSLKSLSEHASDYSDIVNDDLKAVNDQLNVVFNLLADHLSGDSGLSLEEMYEEVSEDNTDAITTGRTEICTNSGVVRGDINIGGIAGSMSIDEEDPEDSAAGSIDYEIGRRFIMKCIIDRCVNEGYITAKKDGAGGVAGFMDHGIVISSESYGSASSTEGNYVGGICGQSFTVIRSCYSLCDVSGNKYVGGIAGYGCTLKDNYAIVNVTASAGKMGAIAGWTAYGTELVQEDEDRQICNNYYVGGEPYGIDGISYVGIAEPVSYETLLAVAGIPYEFRHLKVIYRIDGTVLGTEEVPFGESLAGLKYPDIPEKEGYYGVWPDCSDQVMKGNLVIDGEYKDTVLVVESGEKAPTEGENSYEMPYALVEQIFTEDTSLRVNIVEGQKPEEAAERESVSYEVILENGDVADSDVIAVRLLNPYEKAEVWVETDGAWTRLDALERGRYLQVDMTGPRQVFCVIDAHESIMKFVVPAGVCAALAILAAVLSCIKKKMRPKLCKK